MNIFRDKQIKHFSLFIAIYSILLVGVSTWFSINQLNTAKSMYLEHDRAIGAVNEKEGQDYAKYIIDYCTERSIFPLVELYQNQESFFEQIQKTVPAVVLLALPGVSGLNAAEHLRSLYPGCGVIWCSDLDFSLHAFRLRVEYFFMEPVDEQKIREGFSVWLRHSKAM